MLHRTVARFPRDAISIDGFANKTKFEFSPRFRQAKMPRFIQMGVSGKLLTPT